MYEIFFGQFLFSFYFYLKHFVRTHFERRHFFKTRFCVGIIIFAETTVYNVHILNLSLKLNCGKN